MKTKLFVLLGILPSLLFGQEQVLNTLDKVQVRKFKVQEGGVKIYSDAYLHYVRVMETPFLTTTFKPQSFDEVFEDISKSRNTLVKEFGIAPIKIKNEKRPCFQLSQNYKFGRYRQSKYNSVTRSDYNHIFKQKWIAMDPIDKDQLKAYSKHKCFTDVRLHYDEEAQVFCLRLKKNDGFTEIHAVPKIMNQVREPEYEYAMLARRYQKALNTRRRLYNNRLLREQRKIIENRAKAWRKAWRLFSLSYMSEEEQQMSYEEWLDYFYAICTTEQLSLPKAPADIKVLERSLWLEGFCVSDQARGMGGANDQWITQNVKLNNSESERLVPKNIMTVNLSNTNYMFFNANYGLEADQLLFLRNERYLIVSELINGDYAVSEEIRFDNPSIQIIEVKCEVFPSQFVSVGQIKDRIVRSE